jgi:hypothetical protein
MLCRVVFVRTDVSEELNTSIIRVTRIGELGKTLAVTSNRRTPSSPILVTLMMEALSSSETSVLTKTTRHNIPVDGILNNHRRENLKSYTSKILWWGSLRARLPSDQMGHKPASFKPLEVSEQTKSKTLRQLLQGPIKRNMMADIAAVSSFI